MSKLKAIGRPARLEVTPVAYAMGGDTVTAYRVTRNHNPVAHIIRSTDQWWFHPDFDEFDRPCPIAMYDLQHILMVISSLNAGWGLHGVA